MHLIATHFDDIITAGCSNESDLTGLDVLGPSQVTTSPSINLLNFLFESLREGDVLRSREQRNYL